MFLKPQRQMRVFQTSAITAVSRGITFGQDRFGCTRADAKRRTSLEQSFLLLHFDFYLPTSLVGPAGLPAQPPVPGTRKSGGRGIPPKGDGISHTTLNQRPATLESATFRKKNTTTPLIEMQNSIRKESSTFHILCGAEHKRQSLKSLF